MVASKGMLAVPWVAVRRQNFASLARTEGKDQSQAAAKQAQAGDGLDANGALEIRI
jgi:hypothetical protein